MSLRRRRRRKTAKPAKGDRVVVLAGLPRDTLRWTTALLQSDTSLKPAKYVGAPSAGSDAGRLYGRSHVVEILQLIERETLVLNTNRIIVLYVPSADASALMSALDFVCYLAPLQVATVVQSIHKYHIAWRHKRPLVKTVVYRTLKCSFKATDALKNEITDKRISPFTLPASNFYFPDKNSSIEDTYNNFNLRRFDISYLTDNLRPIRFTRDQLPQRAFKGSAHAVEYFQDMRNRVFPPDLFHGQAREGFCELSKSRLSLLLRQKYRFGVIVRDGKLHYDVQYQSGRSLNNEIMHCAVDGDVLVTGSHANVGVNDVVWVPNGRKVPIKQ